jgi:hypothetical protein
MPAASYDDPKLAEPYRRIGAAALHLAESDSPVTTPSSGKRILIDGQQRVTALMTALLGREVLTRDYETVRIRIAFILLEEKFRGS